MIIMYCFYISCLIFPSHISSRIWIVKGVHVNRNMSNAAKLTHVLCIFRLGQWYIGGINMQVYAPYSQYIAQTGVKNEAILKMVTCMFHRNCKGYYRILSKFINTLILWFRFVFLFTKRDDQFVNMTHFSDMKHVHQNATNVCVHYHQAYLYLFYINMKLWDTTMWPMCSKHTRIGVG